MIKSYVLKTVTLYILTSVTLCSAQVQQSIHEKQPFIPKKYESCSLFGSALKNEILREKKTTLQLDLGSVYHDEVTLEEVDLLNDNLIFAINGVQQKGGKNLVRVKTFIVKDTNQKEIGWFIYNKGKWGGSVDVQNKTYQIEFLSARSDSKDENYIVYERQEQNEKGKCGTGNAVSAVNNPAVQSARASSSTTAEAYDYCKVFDFALEMDGKCYEDLAGERGLDPISFMIETILWSETNYSSYFNLNFTVVYINYYTDKDSDPYPDDPGAEDERHVEETEAAIKENIPHVGDVSVLFSGERLSFGFLGKASFVGALGDRAEASMILTPYTFNNFDYTPPQSVGGTASHELGHLMGLTHCDGENCYVDEDIEECGPIFGTGSRTIMCSGGGYRTTFSENEISYINQFFANPSSRNKYEIPEDQELKAEFFLRYIRGGLSENSFYAKNNIDLHDADLYQDQYPDNPVWMRLYAGNSVRLRGVNLSGPGSSQIHVKTDGKWANCGSEIVPQNARQKQAGEALTESIPERTGLAVYPNPSAGEVTISFLAQNVNSVFELSVTDIVGTKLFILDEGTLKASHSYSKKFDLTSLPPGLYLVVNRMNGKKSVRKLIVE